jgi:hypothetical protein
MATLDIDGMVEVKDSAAFDNANPTIKKALECRMLLATPEPEPGALALLRKTARLLVAKLRGRVHPWDLDTYPSIAPNAPRYVKAVNMLRESGTNESRPSDARLFCFVKAGHEFVGGTKLPRPRAIQTPAPAHAVEFARFIKPIESKIYTLHDLGDNFDRNPVIAKCLNSWQRGRALMEKSEAFVAETGESPLFIALDCTAFDAHVNYDLLCIEHQSYLSLIASEHRRFKTLLDWQKTKTGYAGTDIRYTCRGKRASGHMNTAVGNCWLMIVMIVCAMTTIFPTPVYYDLLDDGDDCLILIAPSNYEKFSSKIKSVFLSYGMVLKIEKVADKLTSIEWCQSRPIEVYPRQWRMIRDYRKVMATSCTAFVPMDAVSRKRYVYSIGLGELHLNRGVPILQSYAKCLMRNTDGEKRKYHHKPNGGFAHRVYRETGQSVSDLSEIKEWPISITARYSFAEAYGVSVVEQIIIENSLDNLSFDVSKTPSGDPSVPLVDPSTWEGLVVACDHRW